MSSEYGRCNSLITQAMRRGIGEDAHRGSDLYALSAQVQMLKCLCNQRITTGIWILVKVIRTESPSSRSAGIRVPQNCRRLRMVGYGR